MKKLKIILQSKLFYIFLIIFCIIYIVTLIKLNNKSYLVPSDKEVIGIINNYKINDDYVSIYLDNNTIVYYSDISNIDNLEYGNKLKFYGEYYEVNHNTIFNNFDYKDYLINHDIYYSFSSDKYELIESNKNIIYKIKNIIYKHTSKIDSSGYISSFIIGIKDIDSNILDMYKNNGVMHIFAISGMHISFLTMFLDVILKRRRGKDIFIISILFIYCLIIGFPVSLLRCFIFLILRFINKLFKLDIDNKRLFIFNIVILLLINYKYIYDIGFLYSVSTCFGILYFGNIKSNNYIIKILYVSMIATIFSLPISINSNYSYNFISFISNIIILPYISFIIYPFSFLVFIFPFLENIYLILINILEYISYILSLINIFNVVFPKLNCYLLVVYYVIVLVSFKYNKRYLVLFIIFLISYRYLYLLDSNLYVYYYDVSQGDSSLIILPYRKSVILIDTGGSYTKTFYDKIILHLKSIGINKIDYLILSHGDNDHMGDADDLVNNFNVSNVIFNCGEYNDLELNLINILDNKNIKYSTCIDNISIDNYKFNFLNTSIYDNENDNSNVIYFNYKTFKFLFMGDASVTREKDILNKYNLSNIDFLKVGHHGSDTSSSKEFIDKINNKYSIISVGKNNRYGHPKESVLDILNNTNIYRTDEDGSIEIKIKNDGYNIKTCSS